MYYQSLRENEIFMMEILLKEVKIRYEVNLQYNGEYLMKKKVKSTPRTTLIFWRNKSITWFF